MLRSEPSFSIYSDSVDGIREEDLLIGNEEALERTVTTGESIEAIGSGDFSFVKQRNMVSIEEEEEEEKEGFNGVGDLGVEEQGKREKGYKAFQNLGVEEEEKQEEGFNGLNRLDIGKEEEEEGKRKGLSGIEKSVSEDGREIEPLVSPHMYFAAGLGIENFDFSGNGNGSVLPSFDDGSEDIEEYFKRMLDDYPLHPLLLSKYAQFLESKGDLHEAEDYYHRYTLVEPDDGEILANYAKLVWRLHRDQTKASHYFERAVRAAPQDSNVLAAYARFLWEIDDGDNEENCQEAYQVQSHGAEEFNLSSIPADSVEYAKSLWDIHHDRDKALHYFEKAVQAAPEDGNVLAAYARFLWEIEDVGED